MRRSDALRPNHRPIQPATARVSKSAGWPAANRSRNGSMRRWTIFCDPSAPVASVANGGVEDPHRDLLVGLRVGDELRACELQRRSLAGELVLDYPLSKRLADDCGRISRAKGAQDLLDVFLRRRRHDPVNHYAWKRDPMLDKACKLCRSQSRELEHRRAEPRAVGRNVVAANQRGAARLPAPVESERQQAKEGPGKEAALKVRLERRIVDLERVGRRRQAIAFSVTVIVATEI